MCIRDRPPLGELPEVVTACGRARAGYLRTLSRGRCAVDLQVIEDLESSRVGQSLHRIRVRKRRTCERHISKLIFHIHACQAGASCRERDAQTFRPTSSGRLQGSAGTIEEGDHDPHRRLTSALLALCTGLGGEARVQACCISSRRHVKAWPCTSGRLSPYTLRKYGACGSDLAQHGRDRIAAGPPERQERRAGQCCTRCT